jgi:hypothetical protein
MGLQVIRMYKVWTKMSISHYSGWN